MLETAAARDDGTSTLLLELDAIPGAVWQAELRELLAPDIRAVLFERGGQKCALLTFATEHEPKAQQAFAAALGAANEVSQQAHAIAAKAASEARERAGREQDASALADNAGFKP